MEIYISDHCATCDYAYKVAAIIRRDFPHVDVYIISINAEDVTVPESVFATPTYLLDGRRWSLGNPSLEEIRRML